MAVWWQRNLSPASHRYFNVANTKAMMSVLDKQLCSQLSERSVHHCAFKTSDHIAPDLALHRLPKLILRFIYNIYGSLWCLVIFPRSWAHTYIPERDLQGQYAFIINSNDQNRCFDFKVLCCIDFYLSYDANQLARSICAGSVNTTEHPPGPRAPSSNC